MDTAFRELFGIELSNYVVESDQGAAVTALCARDGQSQLFCPWLFFRSLKFKEFSLPVGTFVKGRSEAELSTLKRVYETECRDVTEAKRSDLLRRTFQKAGLSIRAGEIVIEDERRFDAVSIWGRECRAPRIRRMPRMGISTSPPRDDTRFDGQDAAFQRSPRGSARLLAHRPSHGHVVKPHISPRAIDGHALESSICDGGASKSAVPEAQMHIDPSTVTMECSESHHDRNPRSAKKGR
jgi:hypothetical protein